MIDHKDKPDDGTWFRHNDDVYDSFYTVREFSHPHIKVMAYIIQRTWGNVQGKAKRQRPVFALDLKDAMEKTGLGASFCSYYYALLNAYVLYEDDGLVGVENHREWWELDRLKANPKLAKKVLMADEVFLQQKMKIVQWKMEILQQRMAEAEEARKETVSEPPKEDKNNKKTTLEEKTGKKTEGSTPKDTPDNQPDPINAIASKLYDTFAEKRGYKKEVNWMALRNMIKTLIKQGYNEEQMVGCLIYLATVDNYFKDGKVDWSLLKIKDKIGWYVKNVHKDKPTKPVKSEGSILDDLYKNFQR